MKTTKQFYCILKQYESGLVEFVCEFVSKAHATTQMLHLNGKLFESDRYHYETKTFTDYNDMKEFVEQNNESL